MFLKSAFAELFCVKLEYFGFKLNGQFGEDFEGHSET